MAPSEPPSRLGPVELRRLLDDTIREIAQGVRLSAIRSGLAERDNVGNRTCTDLAEEPELINLRLLNHNIDQFFTENLIDDKLDYLRKKEEDATTREPAWRPTTGSVDTIPLEAAALLHRKQLLTQRLQEIQPRVKELEQMLLHSKAEMEEVSEKMYKLTRDT